MSISITRADVKRKAMIGVTTYDDAIDDLIEEMQPAIEITIADIYLNDTSNTRLQAALKLGILEMICGEFIEQLRREEGATEQFSAGGVSIGQGGIGGVELITQGSARLAPYLASALPVLAESGQHSTSIDREPAFASAREVTW